jgi:lipopolysaccharide assembly outer membrane protein LptD (OstA)
MLINNKLIPCAFRSFNMKNVFLLLFVFVSTLAFAQEEPVTFKGNGAVFTGDHSIHRSNKQIVEFTGNVHFSTSIVEIEKAEKIVYDKKTKTFTVSGFSELLLNGKKRLASDLGATTLKIDLGDSIVYLVADSTACPDGGKNC